jgi:hypothetical protein
MRIVNDMQLHLLHQKKRSANIADFRNAASLYPAVPSRLQVKFQQAPYLQLIVTDRVNESPRPCSELDKKFLTHEPPLSKQPVLSYLALPFNRHNGVIMGRSVRDQ